MLDKLLCGTSLYYVQLLLVPVTDLGRYDSQASVNALAASVKALYARKDCGFTFGNTLRCAVTGCFARSVWAEFGNSV